jgi:hypothetical protein
MCKPMNPATWNQKSTNLDNLENGQTHKIKQHETKSQQSHMIYKVHKPMKLNNVKPKVGKPKQSTKCANPRNQTTWSQNWWTQIRMHKPQNQVLININNLDFIKCVNSYNWTI